MNKIVNGVANDYEFPNLYDPNISYSKAYTEQLLAEKDKEIDRLNNIIDELEKYLIEHKEVDWDARDTIIHEALAISFVYDILQDLKEGK